MTGLHPLRVLFTESRCPTWKSSDAHSILRTPFSRRLSSCLSLSFSSSSLVAFDMMIPPKSYNNPNHVALFITSSLPFLPSWITSVCQTAQDGDESWDDPAPNPHQLIPIDGDFSGWTPLRIAQEYVATHFLDKGSLFARTSFVVADDRTRFDGKT